MGILGRNGPVCFFQKNRERERKKAAAVVWLLLHPGCRYPSAAAAETGFIITPDAAALLRCCRPCPLLFYRATAVLLLLKHSEVDGNVDDH